MDLDPGSHPGQHHNLGPIICLVGLPAALPAAAPEGWATQSALTLAAVTFLQVLQLQ